MNEQIREKEVRLLSEDGEQLGVVEISKARAMAQEKNLDLVNIAPTAKPPVCKIMDYGKFKYEQAKKDKEAKKKQKVVNVKEVRLRPRIEVHDLDTKCKMAIKFLEKGDKVKVLVRFRGRELGHKDMGKEVIDKFLEMLSDFGSLEKPAKFEGNNLVAIVEPKK